MLASLINAIVLSVDQIGVVPWSLFLWIVWLFLHSVYKKLFQKLLKKISVREPHRTRFVRAYWTIAFTAVTIPFALQNLGLTIDDIRRWPYVFFEGRWLVSKSLSIPVQTKLSYILLSGFYLDSICETSIERGFRNVDFFTNEFLAIFFITTFPLRLVLFGIALITVINAEKLVLEFIRLIITFVAVLKSRLLNTVAICLLLLHTALWCFIYLHFLPKFFLMKTLHKMKKGEDVQHILIMFASTVSLWGYYILEIFISPMSQAVFNYFLGHETTLESLLFRKENLEEDSGRDIYEEVSRVEHHRGNKNKENLLMLYHTVKCLIRIKRKLNRIRQKKLSQAQNSENEMSASTPVAKAQN